jgi:hypothetical protein
MNGLVPAPQQRQRCASVASDLARFPPTFKKLEELTLIGFTSLSRDFFTALRALPALKRVVLAGSPCAKSIPEALALNWEIVERAAPIPSVERLEEAIKEAREACAGASALPKRGQKGSPAHHWDRLAAALEVASQYVPRATAETFLIEALDLRRRIVEVDAKDSPYVDALRALLHRAAAQSKGGGQALLEEAARLRETPSWKKAKAAAEREAKASARKAAKDAAKSPKKASRSKSKEPG